MANKGKIHPLKIQELFSTTDQYLIPIYQRNYAWEKGQVEQLIQDILDFAQINEKKNVPNKYYIGTLVVFERKDKNGQMIYETIDGQQRLTTLSILLSVLRNKFNMEFDIKHILSYESRESSNKTFEAIYRKSSDLKDNIFADRDDYNFTMENAYQTIESKLTNINENNSLKNFINYLLKYVEILRVSVPDDTDLNHYFEIMNNRGEQLEKHEVLKANMLSVFKDTEHDERMVFSKIWDACSDMSRYVQYGFKVDARATIFNDDWSGFQPKCFNEILKVLKNEKNNDIGKGMTLEEIIKPENSYKPENGDDKNISERFTSPVNFENFLLHVLLIMVKNENGKKFIVDNDPYLDDKRLIQSFEPFIKNSDFVKEFGFNLLKFKYLFDNYIIKRDYNTKSEDGKWSLLQVYKNQNSIQYKNRFGNEKDEQSNEQLIMLLSMFHVSNPSQVYKHWLSGALNYLFKQEAIEAQDYIEYLEDMANKFFKRYISTNQIDYDELIFSASSLNFQLDTNYLDQGTNVENFIFNFLDYLLWKKDIASHKDFVFTFKSSVEHFYPQHPKDGQTELPKDKLDSFGNLCLISSSKNSALSNYQPKAKADHYHASGCDSLKQKLMMNKADSWWVDEIEKHQKEMMQVLGL
jgi:hypothetical protein